MKTLKEFLESPEEKRGRLLVIRIPPSRKIVLVPVKVLQKSSEEKQGV